VGQKKTDERMSTIEKDKKAKGSEEKGQADEEWPRQLNWK
jgi:hypothetical protein